MHFPVYAESIGFRNGEKYDVDASQSESVKMLSEAAKTEGVWLLGGPSPLYLVPWISGVTYVPPAGSIPEKDPADGKVYNTSTVYSPQGTTGSPSSSRVGSNIRSRGTRSHP